MHEPVLHAVRCPQCAAPVGAGEGHRLIDCTHCGVRILVRERDGYSRWYFPARVGKLEAVGVGSGWLKRHPEIHRSARSAVIVEAGLLYAPIWEYSALVVGWEFGSRLKTETVLARDDNKDRLDLRLVREQVDEPRLGRRRFYEAAVDLPALGVRRPRITGREAALPLVVGAVESEASVLEATGTAADVAQAGRRSVLKPLVGDPTSNSRLFALQEKVTLLYHPLWLLRYRVGNRLYEMTVDGRDGAIFSARAPAANGRRLLLVLAQIVVLAAVLAMVVGLRSVLGLGTLATVAIAVIVSLAMVFAVLQFRPQGEVEYHEPYSG